MCLHVRIATSRETLFAPIASERCGRGRGGLHGWIDDDHDGRAVRGSVGRRFEVHRKTAFAGMVEERSARSQMLATSLVNGRLKHGPQWAIRLPLFEQIQSF